MTTVNGIHPSLAEMAIDINKLIPLEKNPRHGNVTAIAASYEEFGQLKPIVVTKNANDTFTVIAGNHQLQAAIKLGWDQIAAVVVDIDDSKAVAFALADNRTSALGETDQSLLISIINELADTNKSLFDNLGWDEFEIASLSVDEIRSSKNDNRSGYVAPPEINPFKPIDDATPHIEIGQNNENVYVASPDVDESDAVSLGSPAVGVRGGEKAVVQYTLVFDDSSQQRNWYDFIRYLRGDVAYVGDTTASKLIEFIKTHADF